MQTKLTLRMDDKLIERAKAWARSRDVSLSEAVGQFFAGLPPHENEPKVSAWTRSFIGIGRRPGEKRAPTDEEIREEYVDYLEKKYR